VAGVAIQDGQELGGRAGVMAVSRDVVRRRLALPERGIEVALLDWGGDGPLALLHHANGFCAGLWTEVAELLRHRFRVIAMDARGHGDTTGGDGDAQAFSWTNLAFDLRAVGEALLAETGQREIALGLGHSFGGTLSLTAAALCPDLYARLVLVDPVIIPKLTATESQQRSNEHGLAAGARRRKHVFESRAAAREHFEARTIFAHWTRRALDIYVEEGMRDRPDGKVELKCSGESEAHVYEGAHTVDIFALAEKVQTPTKILWAEKGHFPREIYEALAALMPASAGARVDSIDASHFAVMERPDLVVAQIDD
jgi:pimeloyl-ACP methyl ester carboxylesterase